MTEKHKGLLKSVKLKGLSVDLASSLNSSQGQTKTNASSLNECIAEMDDEIVSTYNFTTQ